MDPVARITTYSMTLSTHEVQDSCSLNVDRTRVSPLLPYYPSANFHHWRVWTKSQEARDAGFAVVSLSHMAGYSEFNFELDYVQWLRDRDRVRKLSFAGV